MNQDRIEELLLKLRDEFRGWRLRFSIDGEAILKGFVCAFLIIFFSLIQTTLFTKFKPFGAIPDLILPLVVAISMTEREKWGAVCGICGAFIIESIGAQTMTLLPVLYMLSGYVCGALTVFYFRDSIAVRALFTVSTCVFRAAFSLIVILTTVGNVTLPEAFSAAVIPEFFANIIFSILPHAAAKLCLKPFHRSRAERVK